MSVSDALARFPDLSIEGYAVARTDINDRERRQLIETMRKAGFPACAKPEALTQFDEPVRLPECGTEPAKAAS